MPLLARASEALANLNHSRLNVIRVYAPDGRAGTAPENALASSLKEIIKPPPIRKTQVVCEFCGGCVRLLHVSWR
ncbi:MAG TPA: hypothetical protein VF624_09690 [Tepidisphaeraceae bacterium]